MCPGRGVAAMARCVPATASRPIARRSPARSDRFEPGRRCPCLPRPARDRSASRTDRGVPAPPAGRRSWRACCARKAGVRRREIRRLSVEIHPSTGAEGTPRSRASGARARRSACPRGSGPTRLPRERATRARTFGKRWSAKIHVGSVLADQPVEQVIVVVGSDRVEQELSRKRLEPRVDERGVLGGIPDQRAGPRTRACSSSGRAGARPGPHGSPASGQSPMVPAQPGWVPRRVIGGATSGGRGCSRRARA